MFLAIPGLIYLFDQSLGNAEGFAHAVSLLDSVYVKMVCTILAWSISHHVLAGIRFLLMDIDIGEQLGAAKISAWVVNFAGVIVFILIAFKIWL